MKKTIIYIYVILIVLLLFFLFRYIVNEKFISLYEDGKYDEKDILFLSFLNINESYIYHYNLGNLYYKNGEYNKAIEEYEKALELQKDKKDIDLVEDLAECYHMKKDYPNALKYYNEVLLVKKDDYNLKYNKALVLHAMEQYNDAIAIYTELLKQKSDDSVVKNNLTAALVALGDMYYNDKNFSLATSAFEQAVELETKDAYAYYGLAKSYRACELNDKAAAAYEKAIALAPDNTEYSNEYAEFISLTNKPVDITQSNQTESAEIKEITLTAEPEVQESTDKNLVNKSLIAKGDANYKSQQYDESIKNYQEALKLNPSDEITLLKIGNIYKIKNDNKNALDFYKKAIVVNPNYADGWFNLGLVYANEENTSKAKECFHRVITLDPAYGYAYYALALAYDQDGDEKEALDNYRIFLTRNKDEAVAKTVRERIKALEK